MSEQNVEQPSKNNEPVHIHIQSLISESMKLSARIIAKLEGGDANEIYVKALNDALQNTTELLGAEFIPDRG
ncbi:hypothetical protein SAMN06265348_109315 [Pedobacter westerhofensis]|uniref:Uncharacterized protein n=1 Tax=Pedobacter westerhofensis TaxID=425512 RepID=A0A521EYX2_9SPHI|nr:hypothetical protein [Pedobacter westerhofensis]SMO89036.1 hypothetical protein SAMN06265348_109315 [Pedobacter westerhofensis]